MAACATPSARAARDVLQSSPTWQVKCHEMADFLAPNARAGLKLADSPAPQNSVLTWGNDGSKPRLLTGFRLARGGATRTGHLPGHLVPHLASVPGVRGWV